MAVIVTAVVCLAFSAGADNTGDYELIYNEYLDGYIISNYNLLPEINQTFHHNLHLQRQG